MRITAKRGKMMGYVDGLVPQESLDSLITYSVKLRDRLNQYISIATVPKATKLGRMVTSLTRVLPIKSDGSCV